MGGGGKSQEEQKLEVARYSMSMHMGLCMAGEGIRLLGIKIGGKWAWRGEQVKEGAIKIKRPGLFGGLKKEGGVEGTVYWLPGSRDQVLPSALAARYGKARTDCPGYRGITSAFFVGERPPEAEGVVDKPRLIKWISENNEFVEVDEPALADYVWNPEDGKYMQISENNPGAAYDPNEQRWVGWEEWYPDNRSGQATTGFIWGANNPYLRPVELRLQRISKGLSPKFESIPIDPKEPNGPLQACNPAHMLYECLHSREWGAGARPWATNRASFEAAAKVLYREAFGLAGIWARQSTIEAFSNEILDHINATIYIDPKTAQFTLKLLRYDYDLKELRVITPADAKWVSMERKAWGETANEIVVTYTDPETGEEVSVTAHDLASIAAQGETVSSSRDYHLVRNGKLAAVLANRELAQSVRPLAAIEIEMPRTAWDIVVGEVVLLRDWVDQMHIETMVCRVANVSRSSPKSNTIRVSLYEDIFAEHINTYLEPEPSEWVPPQVEPAPLLSTVLMTAPAALMASVLKLDDPSDLVDPEAVVMVLAKRNSKDDQFYELLGQATLPGGQVVTESFGTRRFHGTAEIPSTGLGLAVSSTIRFSRVDGNPPVLGQFLLIGNPGADYEIVNVSAVDEEAGTWTILRGLLDTVPQAWEPRTTVWRIPRGGAVPDKTIRAAGETVIYTILPTTSLDTLDVENGRPVGTVVSRRPHLPLRPANVRIDGTRFGDIDATGKTSLLIQWANRNRIVESPQVLAWDEGNVTPEAGQQTVIRLLDSNGGLIDDITTTGTNYTLNRSQFQGRTDGFIRVMAKRDNDYSHQAMQFRITNFG